MKVEILTKTDNDGIQKVVINNIKELILLKNLETGDKLPSERSLSEKFGVSRNTIREAIQKLEFYGILISKPQSGTFIANIGQTAMNGMLDDILTIEDPDFKSLVETRIFLELKTVKLAAKRRNKSDLKNIKKALDAYIDKVLNGQEAVEEDLLFHLSIAKASGNASLNTFMLIIIPQIITDFEKFHVCDANQARKGITEHKKIYEAIEQKDSKMAETEMKIHFKELYKYCYNA